VARAAEEVGGQPTRLAEEVGGQPTRLAEVPAEPAPEVAADGADEPAPAARRPWWKRLLRR
jgi:hypothetical protein